MNEAAFYGRYYGLLLQTRRELDELAESMRVSMQTDSDSQPIVYHCSRIKSAESAKEKLERLGFPATASSAAENLHDTVGLRIICSFTGDVYAVVEKLEGMPSFSVTEKKDYFSYPKQSGYRSIHLLIRMGNGVRAEIQVRTIAMDCWATLEHQLKYKKTIPNSPLIQQELRRCADEIASADLSMQTIREIILEERKAF